MPGTELCVKRSVRVRGSAVTTVRGVYACGGQTAETAVEDEATPDRVLDVWARVPGH